MRLGGDSGGGGRLDGGRVPQHRWARSSRWARTEATASSEQTSRCAPHGIPTRNGRAAFTDHTPTYRSRGAGRPRRPSPAAARAAERIPGSRYESGADRVVDPWPTEIDLQYLLFRLSFSSQVVAQQVYHPIQLARVSHGASPLPSCDPAPRALIHARMGRSLSFTYTSMNMYVMYSTPPWTLSSNSAANGGRGGRPRAPRAARPSQA